MKVASRQLNSSPKSTNDLAKALGLSRWTVSRALNGHPEIHPSTAERVIAAARELGFSPSLLGRGLRSGKTSIIGVCLPDLEDFWLAAKISRLQKALEEKGLNVIFQIVGDSPDEENTALQRFAAVRCSGVISMASRLAADAPALRHLNASDISVVKIDPRIDTGKGLVVATDRASAMAQAVRHFHEKGRRGLVAFGIDPTTPYGQQRVGGLRLGCVSCGWNFETEVHFLQSTAGTVPDDFHRGTALAKQYLAMPDVRPSAILALNDRIAAGAVSVLSQAGLRVPEDVSIIGYDNAGFSKFLTPPLTTFDPDSDALIDLAMELLANPDETGRVVEPIKPQLVIRSSA